MNYSIEISMMTRYLLRNILFKYRDNILPSNSQAKAHVNSSDFNINEILTCLYENQEERFTYVNQLEALVKVYQIHKKQGNFQDLEELESQILYILGYQKTTNPSNNISSQI